MSLIVSIGLLLAAAVTLVVGFAERSLALDYVSIAASAACVVLLVVFTALNRLTVGRRGRAVGSGGEGADTIVEDNRPTQLVEAVSEPKARRGPRVLRGAGRKARAQQAEFGEGTGPELESPVVEPVPEAEQLPGAEPVHEVVAVRRSFFASGQRAVPEVSPEPAPASPEQEPEPVPVRRSLLGSRRTPVAGQVSAEPAQAGTEPERVSVRRSLLGSRRRTLAEEASPEPEPVGEDAQYAQDAAVPSWNSAQAANARGAVPLARDGEVGPSGWEDIEGAELEPLAHPEPARRPFFESRRRPMDKQVPRAEEPASPFADHLEPSAVFPIADYDELRVSEVLPLLSELVPDEYEVVRQRELAGRGRTTILRRLEELQARVAVPSGTAGRESDWSLQPYGDANIFPIANYDALRVAEILPLLRQLDPHELEVVRNREQAGAARTTILKRINAMVRSANEASTGPAERASGAAGRAAEQAAATRGAGWAAKPEEEAATTRAARSAKARSAYSARKAAATPLAPGGGPATGATKVGAPRATKATGYKAAGARATKAAGGRPAQAGGAREARTAGAGATQDNGAAANVAEVAAGGPILPAKDPPTGSGPVLKSRRPSAQGGSGT